MATLYDSVNPELIPRDAELVAGLINGKFAWQKWEWEWFSQAKLVKVQVYIPTELVSDQGLVLDIAGEDAETKKGQDACGWWVEHRMRSGVRPCICTNKSCREYVEFEGIDYWLADYTNQAHLLPGTVATKWASYDEYDVSLTNGLWP